MYIINFDLKHAERDNYETGCDPDTAITTGMILRLEAPSLKELIEKVEYQFEVTDKDLLFNACGENGRLDVQTYEYYNGYTANYAVNDPDSTMGKAWREGRLRIWLATYTGTVYIETLKKVNLKEYTK